MSRIPEANGLPNSDSERPSRQAATLAWLETALFVLGAACLLYVAWVLVDAHWFQQRALEHLTRAAPAVEEGAAAEIDLPAGTPLARLTVPRLDLAVAVAEGTGDEVLQRAVGHLERTPLPGEGGHVVLAGHRDTFFRPLERIELGDRISLDAPSFSTTYEVEWFRIIDPSELWVLEDPGYPALTLITCYPFRFVGNAPQRFIVRAKRIEASTLAQRTTPSTAGGG